MLDNLKDIRIGDYIHFSGLPQGFPTHRSCTTIVIDVVNKISDGSMCQLCTVSITPPCAHANFSFTCTITKGDGLTGTTFLDNYYYPVLYVHEQNLEQRLKDSLEAKAMIDKAAHK